MTTGPAMFDPQQYDRLTTCSVPGYAALQELIALAAAATAPSANAAVLDLGCGTGAGLLALARALPAARLVGCDPAPPMVATARTRCEAAGVKVELVVGDLAAIAHDAQFDVVVCTLVLHFVAPAERGALLAAIRAHLRPGGSLVITALGYAMDPGVQAEWAQLRRHYAIAQGLAPAVLAARGAETQGRVFPIAPDELAETLRGAGFAGITPLYQLLAVHTWLARS